MYIDERSVGIFIGCWIDRVKIKIIVETKMCTWQEVSPKRNCPLACRILNLLEHYSIIDNCAFNIK